MTDEPAPRTPTEIDGIAEAWVSTMIDLDPDTAIWLGMPGRIGEIGDPSPAGHERYIAEAKRVLAALGAAAPVDEVDEVTKAYIVFGLELELQASEARLQERDLNVIASPAQGIREVFDLMPTSTEKLWKFSETFFERKSERRLFPITRSPCQQNSHNPTIPDSPAM